MPGRGVPHTGGGDLRRLQCRAVRGLRTASSPPHRPRRLSIVGPGSRRWRVVVAVVALLAAMSTAGWFAWQWREREAALSRGLATVDASIRAEDLDA